MEQKFFLYARKSTDVEDKQVLSIDAQLTELRSFAREQNLEVVEEFIEKQSAKIPGRPIVGQMLKRIEHGEVNGIVSWHHDRLARNSVDGGQIIYFLDTGKLASMKFPSQAPLGYINDSRTKTIVVEKKKAKIIRLAFERYAKGNQRLEDISNFLAKNGIVSRGGKRIHKTRATFILSNPFYTGLFNYADELHEGKHEPIISKKLFDSVQEVMKLRGQPERKAKNEPQAFCGLLSCAECGMMITGEYKVKKQKNGNVHNYTYYHCTKKNKNVKCSQPCIREEELDRQLSSKIQKVSLPRDWAEELEKMARSDFKNSAQSVGASVKEKETKISVISQKLERLLNTYLDQDIEKEIYRVEKAKLILQKKSLEEEMTSLSHKHNDWLEPM